MAVNRLVTTLAERQPLLVVYLTLGDTATPLDLAREAVDAGADVVELGIPTPSTNPRGAVIRESFARARGVDARGAWRRLRELRAALPTTPLVPLIYPETFADVGVDRLLAESSDAGADALVLTQPRALERVQSAGLSAIPVVRPNLAPEEQHALEDAADLLTYRPLAPSTGAQLDPEQARAATAELARTARKPYLVGFGIRTEADVRAVARGAAGVVVGSELIRRVAAAEPARRADVVRAAVRSWKTAAQAVEEPV